MTTYVVCQAVDEDSQKRMMAWGVMGSGPGFDEVTCTLFDGSTIVDVPARLRIESHLFTVRSSPVAQSDEQRRPGWGGGLRSIKAGGPDG